MLVQHDGEDVWVNIDVAAGHSDAGVLGELSPGQALDLAAALHEGREIEVQTEGIVSFDVGVATYEEFGRDVAVRIVRDGPTNLYLVAETASGEVEIDAGARLDDDGCDVAAHLLTQAAAGTAQGQLE